MNRVAVLVLLGAVPVARAQTLNVGRWTLRWDNTQAVATGSGDAGTRTLYQKDGEDCADFAFSGRVLSVVGSLVAVETVEGGDCGGVHPMAWDIFSTQNLDDGPVSLFDYFEKKDVEAAMAADPFLKKFQDDSCEFSLVDYDKKWAVYDWKDGRAAIRVGLSHGCEVRKGNLTQIGMWLRPKPSFARAIEEAARARRLMKHFAKSR